MPTDVITENTSAQNATADNLYTGVAQSNPDTEATIGLPDGPGYQGIQLNAASADRRLLIRFDGLSNIPSNATITSAEIWLNPYGSYSGYNYDIYRVLQAWDDEDASWDEYDNSANLFWNTAGCNGVGTDREGTPITTHAVNTSTSTYFNIDVTSWCQDVVDGTISSDEGLLFVADATTGQYDGIRGNGETDGTRPELVVTYTTPTGITSGTYTIGSGGDYATVDAFMDDVRLGGSLTGDVIGQCTDNAIYAVASATTLDAGSVTLNGFNIYLRATGSGLHGGDRNTGARLQRSAAFAYAFPINNVLIEDLVLENTSGNGGCVTQSTSTSYIDVGVFRCILISRYEGCSTGVGQAEGCLILPETGFEGEGDGLTGSGSDVYFFNNTVYDKFNGLSINNADAKFANNVAYGCTNDMNVNASPTDIFTNNAADTGDGIPGTNPVNLTSDPFVDSANGDFTPSDGGQLDDAGSATYLPTLDNARDTYVTNDIGAFIAEVSGGGGLSATITQVTEADVAQTITPDGGAVSQTIGQVTSIHTAQPITPLNSLTQALAQTLETDVAQPMTVFLGPTTVSLGQVTETDVAQPIVALQGLTAPLVQVTSTGEARDITPLIGAVIIPIGMAEETDSVFSITTPTTQIATITMVVEVDQARNIFAVNEAASTVKGAVKDGTNGTVEGALSSSVIGVSPNESQEEGYYAGRTDDPSFNPAPVLTLGHDPLAGSPSLGPVQSTEFVGKRVRYIIVQADTSYGDEIDGSGYRNLTNPPRTVLAGEGVWGVEI